MVPVRPNHIDIHYRPVPIGPWFLTPSGMHWDALGWAGVRSGEVPFPIGENQLQAMRSLVDVGSSECFRERVDVT